MENINAYLANTTQADIAASDNQQPFINAKDLPLVTNQGIYKAKVIDAYLNDYNGQLKMSLNLFAELEGRPEHKGLLKLYINVFYTPEGGKPEIARHFINVLSACKCFDEHGRPWANQVEKQANNGVMHSLSLVKDRTPNWCNAWYTLKNSSKNHKLLFKH